MSKTQVEVITSVQRRRRWAISEKERIVAAALEPGAAILEQLELSLADLEEDASAAATAAQMAAAQAKIEVRSFERRKQRAGRCPSICRASASYIRYPRAVRAAAACCTRSAKT
jgi:transposase-like protein